MTIPVPAAPTLTAEQAVAGAVFGGLYDYATATYLRPATEQELAQSDAADAKGEHGVFDLDGRSVYVER